MMLRFNTSCKNSIISTDIITNMTFSWYQCLNHSPWLFTNNEGKVKFRTIDLGYLVLFQSKHSCFWCSLKSVSIGQHVSTRFISGSSSGLSFLCMWKLFYFLKCYIYIVGSTKESKILP